MAEIMIVVGIVIIISAIAIPNLLRAKVNANESSAQATLKTISTALENYYAINNDYPLATGTLLTANPPYLSKDFFTGAFNGYNFTATLTNYSYSILAVPAAASQGITSYTISTGGVLAQNP